MSGFVGLHLFDDGAAAPVRLRQFPQMLAEMRFHLPLGFDDKSQTDFVAHQRRRRADCETSRIPHGIEQTGAALQRIQSIGTPRQVIGFFLRSGKQLLAGGFVARDGGLTGIQCLRAHFAGVIHAHQAGSVFTGRFIERSFVDSDGRRWAFGFVCRAERRGQGAIGFLEQAVCAG